MLDRSSIVKSSLESGMLTILGFTIGDKPMKAKDKSPSLQKQYLEILQGSPDDATPSQHFNLEQPYAGRIVQAVTTYSVSEKPEQLQQK